MSTQKQRHTKTRRDRARVFLKLKTKSLVKCANCGASAKAHCACPKCGYYRGRKVKDTAKKPKKGK